MTTETIVLSLLGGTGIVGALIALIAVNSQKNKAEMEVKALGKEVAQLSDALSKEKQRNKDEMERVGVYHADEIKRAEDEVRRLHALLVRRQALGDLNPGALDEAKRSPYWKPFTGKPESEDGRT